MADNGFSFCREAHWLLQLVALTAIEANNSSSSSSHWAGPNFGGRCSRTLSESVFRWLSFWLHFRFGERVSSILENLHANADHCTGRQVLPIENIRNILNNNNNNNNAQFALMVVIRLWCHWRSLSLPLPFLHRFVLVVCRRRFSFLLICRIHWHYYQTTATLRLAMLMSLFLLSFLNSCSLNGHFPRSFSDCSARPQPSWPPPPPLTLTMASEALDPSWIKSLHFQNMIDFAFIIQLIII